MAELGVDDTRGMSVTLSIPTTADGVLKLLGIKITVLLIKYKLYCIIQ